MPPENYIGPVLSAPYKTNHSVSPVPVAHYYAGTVWLRHMQRGHTGHTFSAGRPSTRQYNPVSVCRVHCSLKGRQCSFLNSRTSYLFLTPPTTAVYINSSLRNKLSVTRIDVFPCINVSNPKIFFQCTNVCPHIYVIGCIAKSVPCHILIFLALFLLLLYSIIVLFSIKTDYSFTLHHAALAGKNVYYEKK